MLTAMKWGDTIPIGVIYRNDRPPFREHLATGPLVGRELDRSTLEKIMEAFA
jgi:2-oxoglutarate ferredoxin oxidoreductase subunit beta